MRILRTVIDRREGTSKFIKRYTNGIRRSASIGRVRKNLQRWTDSTKSDCEEASPVARERSREGDSKTKTKYKCAVGRGKQRNTKSKLIASLGRVKAQSKIESAVGKGASDPNTNRNQPDPERA